MSEKKVTLPAIAGIKSEQKVMTIKNIEPGGEPLEIVSHEGQRVALVAALTKVEVVLKDGKWKARLLPSYRPRFRGERRP